MSLRISLTDIAENILLFGMKPPQEPPHMLLDLGYDTLEAFTETSTEKIDAPRRMPQGLAHKALGRDFMWQSIRLSLMSRRLASTESPVAERLAAMLNEKADWIFEHYCARLPQRMLMEWLLLSPPPAPQWELALQNAVSFVEAGVAISGEFGEKLQQTGARMFAEVLGDESRPQSSRVGLSAQSVE